MTIHQKTLPKTKNEIDLQNGRLFLNNGIVVLGDALECLMCLESNQIQTIITSPPYWGMRDYDVSRQVGLNENLGEYIHALGRIFQECRRVLRDDGTLWLVIGDGYTSGNRGWRAPDKKNKGRYMSVRPNNPDGLKNKELQRIPWVLASTLQAHGWYFRSDIVWYKPNAQPESVKDRVNRSHEYVLMFSKSGHYKFYKDRIKEKGRNGLRSRRSVWGLKTEPVKDAHFATFPETLVEICVNAGSDVDDYVLDPFLGSGTTLKCALQHHRKALGIELQSSYKEVIRRRTGLSESHFVTLSGSEKERNMSNFDPIETEYQEFCVDSLQDIREKRLQEAVLQTIQKIEIRAVYDQRLAYVKDEILKKFTAHNVPVETVFPIPILLEKKPELVTYYRLLFGYGYKKFYKLTGFRYFKNAEDWGQLSETARGMLPEFCQEFAKAAENLLETIDSEAQSSQLFHELTLLTYGAGLHGKWNNELSVRAIANIRSIILEIISNIDYRVDGKNIYFQNDLGHRVDVLFRQDPDISVLLSGPDFCSPKLAIEVKGGRDQANARNRMGESEKSHLAATQDFESRWTIVNVEKPNIEQYRTSSPSSTRLFNLNDLNDKSTNSYREFQREFMFITQLK